MNVFQNFRKNIFIVLVFFGATELLYAHSPIPAKNFANFEMISLADRLEFLMCDTCSCGSSGGSIGYGTGLNSSFIGVRYIGQYYQSKDGIFNNSPWIDEYFNTVQLWANIPLTSRAKLKILVPYQFHNREFTDGSNQEISGMGDMSILGFYNLIEENIETEIGTTQHYFHVGGGLKLPTGTFDRANNLGSVNPSFQLGNGSWDFVLASNYGFVKNDWGVSSMLNYTIKTENPKAYQFGNQLNYGLNVFKNYRFPGSFRLTPMLGVAGEHYASNKEFGVDVLDTKGEVFLGKFSLETNYKSVALGMVGMLPIYQNLNQGNVKLKHRVSFYLNINL